jgi:hypothetical protein
LTLDQLLEAVRTRAPGNADINMQAAGLGFEVQLRETTAAIA